MSATNIVTSMEALMAQVKELQTDRAAAEERALEAVARAAELRETVATLTQGMHIAALNLGVDNIALESVPSGKVARVQVEALVALCSQAAGAPRVGSSPQAPAPQQAAAAPAELDIYHRPATPAEALWHYQNRYLETLTRCGEMGDKLVAAEAALAACEARAVKAEAALKPALKWATAHMNNLQQVGWVIGDEIDASKCERALGGSGGATLGDQVYAYKRKKEAEIAKLRAELAAK